MRGHSNIRTCREPRACRWRTRTSFDRCGQKRPFGRTAACALATLADIGFSAVADVPFSEGAATEAARLNVVGSLTRPPAV